MPYKESFLLRKPSELASAITSGEEIYEHCFQPKGRKQGSEISPPQVIANANSEAMCKPLFMASLGFKPCFPLLLFYPSELIGHV